MTNLIPVTMILAMIGKEEKNRISFSLCMSQEPKRRITNENIMLRRKVIPRLLFILNTYFFCKKKFTSIPQKAAARSA